MIGSFLVTPEARELITESLNRIGVAASNERLERLLTHAKQVEQWGVRLGLTKATGRMLVTRHLLDSLVALPYFLSLNPESLADLGSGAGFPGLCLAVFMPKTRVTLIERMQKRAGFLLATQALMRLSNIHVNREDFFTSNKIYSALTFRAITTVSPKLAAHMLARCETVVAYKGRVAEAEKERSALVDEGFKSQIIHLQPIEPGTERVLLVVKK